MAEVMCLEHLPLEVLEVIATYLSAADLSRCLAVSRNWYSIFSSDIFWKRHCILGHCNLGDYFSKTNCVNKPFFKPPLETHLPIPQKRLQFLQEQHLWLNWNLMCSKNEEIEFECDNSISYNIKLSFFDNDHICLHRTFETEVWNVADVPFSVMAINYCLNELWEESVYKVVGNNLFVIQCNVVQVYEINLESVSWCLKKVFFFNKPEEFSTSITSETDVDALFQLENIIDENDFERIICGQYLVGAYMKEKSPPLHIWNIKTGNKLKEDKCEIFRGSYSIKLKASSKVSNQVLVTFTFENGSVGEGGAGRCCSIVYNLELLQFDMSTRQYHSGDVLFFDGYLSIVDGSPLKMLRYSNVSTKSKTEIVTTNLPDCVQFVTSIRPLNDNLLISTNEQVFLLNISEVPLKNPVRFRSMKVDFTISHMEVLFNKYILLHDVKYESIKELWLVEKSIRKLGEYPSDSGTYLTSNNACSKIVLERGNKLIVLNFW